ncbi:Outer membrane protein TolC precursor [Vibrio aerogenes CECT 7868]|uniref:Outer membrane protein TolC n=1 Tax=Vibrio aerogenes CECT 7868 TaxID=1216006 RepID=A0A1M5XS08_9VIBR|nr:TolC family protein [Vibrio aerogenes]SHI02601.1 Outer membrane protein TolC precursor [Vibrio aerogenes CECT 7868]
MTNARFLRHSLPLMMTLVPCMTHAMSLDEAWQAAQKYAPELNQAKLDVRISESGKKINRGALLPSLSAGSSIDWQEREGNSHGYHVTLKQSIWDSRSWTALDQAKADVVKAQLEQNQVRNDLADKLITAYLDLASAQGDLHLAQQKLAEGNKLLKITRQRYKAGKVKSIDVEEMLANQLNEKSAILQAKILLAEKQAAFSSLISASPAESFPEQQKTEPVDEVDTQLVNPPLLPVNTEAQWLKLAKNHSPALLVASQQLRLQQLEKTQAKNGYYPSLEGHVSYQDNDNLPHGEMNAGISLSLPLDLNGATRAKVEQAGLKILRAREAVRQVEINLTKDIRRQFAQLALNQEQVAITRELVAHQTRVLQSKETLFNAGLSEASDVIEAHNALFTARNDLKSNLYQYWRQQAGLLLTAGLLDDQSIAAISKAFNS